MEKIYSWKINKGAFSVMVIALKFPEQVDYLMDEKICRVTDVSYSIAGNIKECFHEKFKSDKLLQVKIHNVEERYFLIFQSLLTRLDEEIFALR